MHICLDIDDTITYCPEFFSKISTSFEEARISIVTFREERSSTEDYLKSVHIRYDQLVLSSDPVLGKSPDQSLAEWKAGFVNSTKPDLFFEDMPEVIALIDSGILVFMACDEVIRKWIANQLRPPEKP